MLGVVLFFLLTGAAVMAHGGIRMERAKRWEDGCGPVIEFLAGAGTVLLVILVLLIQGVRTLLAGG